MSVDPFDAICKQYGNRFDPEVLEQTMTHWASRVNVRAGAAHVPKIEDVPYGEHERQRLDLFPVESSGAPVVLFVHGGGFVAGDKRVSPTFYANVGRYFAAHGIVSACMNYRLAPTGGWPAAAHDVEAAVSWLLDRADLYGGNPEHLIVIGQSAGACHVATWLFDPTLQGGKQDKISGAVLMSGFYQASEPLTPGQKAYFGDDAVLYPQRSPLTHAKSISGPTLITCAEHDPPYLRRHSHELHAALSRSVVMPGLVDLRGHNHVSPVMSLGSDDDTTGTVLREFITTAMKRDPGARSVRAVYLGGEGP